MDLVLLFLKRQCDRTPGGGGGATTGPGALPAARWEEVQVAGQAVCCLCSKLAAALGADQAAEGRALLAMATELLAVRIPLRSVVRMPCGGHL